MWFIVENIEITHLFFPSNTHRNTHPVTEEIKRNGQAYPLCLKMAACKVEEVAGVHVYLKGG